MSLLRSVAFVILLVAATSGCGGKPFNVKPRPDLPQPQEYGSKAAAGGLTVQAEAMRDEDFLFETFDANLMLAGVLPVRVALSNAEQAAVDLRKAKFEILVTGGRAYKAISAESAYKRMISYYGITTYSKAGYKESQADFASHALDLKSPLEPSGRREGMIFFYVPDEAARIAPLTLVGKRLDANKNKDDTQIELRLN